MIISISGIDGSGKTSLIKALSKGTHFFVPEHVSTYIKFPEDLVEWYTKADINEVVILDLKAFALRNNVIKKNALIDRGYQNVIDSVCARYQERLDISYTDSLERVIKINKVIGLTKIEDTSILLDFPFDDWQKICDIITEREGTLSDKYLGYLKILNQNIKDHRNSFDIILDATKTIEQNLKQVLSFTKSLQTV